MARSPVLMSAPAPPLLSVLDSAPMPSLADRIAPSRCSLCLWKPTPESISRPACRSCACIGHVERSVEKTSSTGRYAAAGEETTRRLLFSIQHVTGHPVGELRLEPGGFRRNDRTGDSPPPEVAPL